MINLLTIYRIILISIWFKLLKILDTINQSPYYLTELLKYFFQRFSFYYLNVNMNYV